MLRLTRIARFRCIGHGSRRWALAASALALAMTASAGPGAEPSPALRRLVRDTVRQVLRRALSDSAFPGAYAVVGTRRAILASVGVGRLDWAPSPPTDENTLWDLASLTKVVGTTTAMMQLWERGAVALDTPVSRYLPELSGAGIERVTLRDLLSHSSGLPAWRPIYKEAGTPAEGFALVFATPLDTAPGVRYVYSDLGAIILGKVVERVSGEPLDRYLDRHVFAPLAMHSTRFRPPASWRARIAPTEVDPWRNRHLRGEVHDENAFALGGIAGHAGLFSSAHDLTRFAQMLLSGGVLHGRRIIHAATLDTFTHVRDSAFSNRALGWEVPNGDNSAGHRMGARAFGHTGFTGTSLWIDPGRDLFVILLTNRVNPTRSNPRLGPVRVALADAVESVLAAANAIKSSAESSP